MKLEIVSATAQRSERAAIIRAQRKIPYADAFGVDLTSDSPEHVFVTADFDVKPAEDDIAVESLPVKSKA